MVNSCPRSSIKFQQFLNMLSFFNNSILNEIIAIIGVLFGLEFSCAIKRKLSETSIFFNRISNSDYVKLNSTYDTKRAKF